MPASRPSRLTAAALLGLAFALLLVTVATIAACGSDPYSGTWKGDVMGQAFTLNIEKSGDNWVVTSPDDTKGKKITGTEENGKLVLKDPASPESTMTFERKDDKLVMTAAGLTVEMTKQ